MQLTEDLLRTFGMGRVFKNYQARVNSVDFHRSEDLLVTAGDDDAIRLYNTQSGMEIKHVLSKKHGVCNLCYTHAPQAVIHASNKGLDHTLRYLSLHDNRYLRYFKGHTQQVTTLCLSPKNDLFMSAAQDRQVRLWDLRTNICQGLLTVPGQQPCAAFDQQGLVFGVGTDKGVVKLFDVRSYAQGPFDAFTVVPELHTNAAFSHIQFSADGKLMLCVVEGHVYQLDAYNGDLQQSYSTGVPQGALGLGAVFSPDSNYILSGCADKSISIWSTKTGQKVHMLTGHAGVPTTLQWHPRRMLVASACNALAFWTPDPKKLAAPSYTYPIQ